MAKEYDYLLKVLLVGDSDVGKTEILNNLEQDPLNEDGKSEIHEINKRIANIHLRHFQPHIKPQSYF